MPEIIINQSKLMVAFNKARKACRVASGLVERKRLNKALGLVMSGQWQEKISEYHTTIDRCDCPDGYRGYICKHRLALMLLNRMKYPLPVDYEEYMLASTGQKAFPL